MNLTGQSLSLSVFKFIFSPEKFQEIQHFAKDNSSHKRSLVNNARIIEEKLKSRKSKNYMLFEAEMLVENDINCTIRVCDKAL